MVGRLTVSNGLVVVFVLKVNDGNSVEGLALDLAGRTARLGRSSSSSDVGGSSSCILGLPSGLLCWFARMIARRGDSKTSNGQDGGGLEQHFDEQLMVQLGGLATMR